jgi:UDP-N-acetylmuramate dehydrogenase
MPIEKLIQKNFDLTPFTNFRIGGQAEFFMIIKNKQELIKAIAWAKAKKLPLAILAGGSNILIIRKKIKGLVLKISGEHYFIKKNYVTCWAGTSLTKLAKISASAGLTGLEWSFGIPGSLGGAVRGNAGAYGFDMSGSVAEVEAYDLIKNQLVKLNNQACGFSYRSSVFKERKNLLIVGVKLKLAKGVPREIKALSQKNFNHRFESKPKEPSAGCIFKNLEYKKAIKQNKKLAEDLAAKGLVRGDKIGVGYLIDQLGLKGKTVGGAKVSEKHANFIINTGKAQSKDVVSLINLIKIKIKHKYKINLEEEIQYF